MAIPEWVNKVTELAKSIARLTGNVEALQREVERLTDKLDKSNEKINQLEQGLALAKAELKGEAQIAAVNAVIQAHEQMIDRIQKVEGKVQQLPPPS
jgi:chromosome segregation ATPase